MRDLAAVIEDFKQNRITGPLLQEAAELGLWQPSPLHVLLKAVHAVDGAVAAGVVGADSVIMQTAKAAGAVKQDARDAVCFVVLAVGDAVSWCRKGDLVQQTSASGDVVDHTDPTCPYWLIHEQDITAVIRLPETKTA